MRHPRYRTRPTTNNLKCHGARISSSPGGVANLFRSRLVAETGALMAVVEGVSRTRWHRGHEPSAPMAVGVQYLAHSLQKGIDHSLRLRTRSFSGVDPNSKASRIQRSRYRKYVRGNSRLTKSVNVGGSVAPWRAYITLAPPPAGWRC